MSKKRTKKRKSKKYNLTNQTKKTTPKTKTIINDYSYFPPFDQNESILKFYKLQEEKTIQLVKQHHLDLNKPSDFEKINDLLDEDFNQTEDGKKIIDNLDKSGVMRIFNSLMPYMSLSQFVNHYYFCLLHNDRLTEDQKSKTQAQDLFDLDFFKHEIKKFIKSWTELIPKAKKLILDFINKTHYSREESGFWAGLMRDKPLLPILGSLMDLWFYPMLNLEADFNPGLDEVAFLSLIEKGFEIEKIMVEELSNQEAEAIINQITTGQNEIPLTYPLPRLANSQSRWEILNENTQKIKEDSFAEAIFTFITDHFKILPRFILSLARFGPSGEYIRNFVQNLNQDFPNYQLDESDDEEINVLKSYLKNLQSFLSKYQAQIKDAIVNKKVPHYDLLNYILEHFTIRPALPGIIYWNKIENVPHLEKLLSLALKTEISYLKTISELPLKSFRSWYKTTKYET